MANEQAGQKKQEEVEVNTQKWSQLVAQAWADEKLKQRLLDDPKAVLREQGIKVPAGAEVRVVQPTDKLLYFVLPPKPANVSELTSSQLTGVAAGAKDIELELGPGTVTPVCGNCYTVMY